MILFEINGSNFVNNPVETAFSTFTNFFQGLVGNGDVFYLIPLICFTFGIWYKTDEPIMASMFMIGSGAILGTTTLFIGFTTLGILFTIFCAMGFVALVMGLIFNKR